MPPTINQMFPPAPTFVEHDIPDLAGRVFLITGATSGIGFEAATIVYSKNATVYIAARSADKAQKAIAAIQNSPECATSRGRLFFLSLDLSDLTSIKASADEFLGREDRLDVLIHNAGVMTPPAGSKTKLGHDLEMGTNSLGPFLFNQFLLPLLKHTATIAQQDSVRVVWLSSMVSHGVVHGGFVFDKETGAPAVLKNAMENYMQSKVGNLFLASEMAKRVGQDGVLSLSVHPGIVKTELQRHGPAIQGAIMGVVFKPSRYGAYTELFAGLSPRVVAKHNGAFIVPWGRFGSIPCSIEKGLSPATSGGTGAAERFWAWCDQETAAYRLRCDRLRPCSSCVKRGIHCAYAHPTSSLPPSRHHQPGRSTKQLHQRIQQLEELVQVLGGSENTRPREPSRRADGDGNRPENEDDALTNSVGRIQVGESGTSYVSGAHWAALQHCIAEIRECTESDPIFTHSIEDESPKQGSALLLGFAPPIERDRILELLPPKPTVDLLVSRFFHSMEPGILIIHAPTFQKTYNRFWEQPQEVNLTWLSLLFSIMCLAINLRHRLSGDDPDPIPDSQGASDNFRTHAAHCLIQDNYTTPSRYTVEALLLYTHTEYFRSPDAQHEIWVLMGLIVRLAMRMGLHRDGSRYPGISCFEAEMRRRIWALLSQLDALFSFQMGLPRMIHGGCADTQLPHNLLDEEFDEDTTVLPPPRPDTVFTPASYLISKGRIADVFGLISDHVTSTQPSSYQTILQLDSQLNQAYASILPPLQFRSVGQAVTELPHITMSRYTLEILYQKSRCILHRKHLGEGRSDPRYSKSRQTCLDAAMKLLQHQATIDAQTKPGGVLGENRWFATSLAAHDFILAAMILCLELHYLSRNGPSTGDGEVYPIDELVGALRTSRQIWDGYRQYSAEASQAWRSIGVMLDKLNIPPLSRSTPSPLAAQALHGVEPARAGGFAGGYANPPTQIHEDSRDQPHPYDSGTDSPTNLFSTPQKSMMGIPLSGGDFPGDNLMEEFCDFSNNNIDWVQWDAMIQNVT